MTLRPDRFCNFVYRWMLPLVEDKRQLDLDLIGPLPGRAKAEPTPAQLEAEAAEFMSFMGTMTGKAG